MAASVSWDSLRELANFQVENGCAISLYLDLDPSITPTAGDVQTLMRFYTTGRRDGAGAL